MPRVKLARPDLILVVVAILGLVLCGYLAYDNMGQAQRQASLEQRLVQASAQLRELLKQSQDPDELKAKEAKLRSDIKEIVFATESQAKGMSISLLGQARDSGLEVDRLLMRQGTESVGERKYTVYKYSLTLSGHPAALAMFMVRLSNLPRSTMTVESLDASSRGASWEMKLEITVFVQPS